jgi:hypothetical protein
MNKLFKQPLFIEVLSLTIVVAIIHWIASIYYFYYLVPNLDILMHFLGGLLIGLIILSLLFVRRLFGFAHTHHGVVITTTLFGVLLIGLGWELFEVFFDMTAITRIDLFDTLLDLVMDLIGGGVSLWWYYSMVWNRVVK